MEREALLATLKLAQDNLKSRGVAHAALFGSQARGDAHPGSDIDVLVELDTDRKLDLFDYVEVVQYIKTLFDSPVDVVNRATLKDYVRPRIESDAVYVF